MIEVSPETETHTTRHQRHSSGQWWVVAPALAALLGAELMGHGAELSYREEEACTVWSYLTDRPWGMGRGYSEEKESGVMASI